jgi:GT2 family glycosyltransferase
MNIGIGVCSYKRPELATNTCKSILATIDRSINTITTVCSLDDSDATGYDWIAENFNLIHGKNEGISYNKNRLIKYLEGNDYIFLAEDDILFLKPGWTDLYIKACVITGYQHFNYIVSDYRAYIKRTIQYEDITLGDSGSYVNGILMMMSKKCIETVGGFDERYKKYGYEHVDYTNRCKKAKLYPEFNIHIMEATPYIDWIHSESCFSEEEKKLSIKNNAKLFHAPVESIYNGSYKEAAYTSCII